MVLTGRLTAVALLSLAASQQIGNKIPEVHPSLTTYKCTKASGCTAQNTSVVVEQEGRIVSVVNGTGVCKEPRGGSFNSTLCPDAVTCAKNCALEGANYTSLGVKTNADSLKLDMYVDSDTASPRVYLLDQSGKNYEDLRLLNAEISFDVDMTKLPCGMNAAFYLSEMNMTGGRSELNPAGASMGTGYCDAQCYNYYKWINGVVSRPHSLS
jgi:cellulase